MPDSRDFIRRQIAQNITDPTVPIEKQIASAFQLYGEYCGDLRSDQLGVILRKVLYTLVAEQKVVGFNVPLLHNVSQMAVKIINREAHVRSEVHIHSPVTAFIRFKYILENASDGSNLRVKKHTLKVEQSTKPFDMAAKLALKVMDVESIARHELNNPSRVIRRTLPAQLAQYGYVGAISSIELLLMDETLSVFMKVEPNN